MTRKEAVGADARIRPRVDASIDPYNISLYYSFLCGFDTLNGLS